jgi:hypothetical protein
MSSVFLTIVFSVDGVVCDVTVSVMCFNSTIYLGWNEHIFLNEEHFPPFLVLIVVENELQPEIKRHLFASSVCVRFRKQHQPSVLINVQKFQSLGACVKSHHYAGSAKKF